MKPDLSRWRDHSSYDFYNDLTPEGLAWECLRRNKLYQAYYRRLARDHATDRALPTMAETRWGLRFPGTTIPDSAIAAGALVTHGQSCRHHPCIGTHIPPCPNNRA